MNKGHIICVDDEIAVLETLKEQLRKHFGDTHEIEISTSAEEALALIDEISRQGLLVELVITDQVMPRMTGDIFLEKVHQKLPDAIKILLTGHAGLDSAIHAINFGGISRYIEKPWDMENLHEDIENLIAKFRQNVENLRIINELNQKITKLEANKNHSTVSTSEETH